MNNITRRQPYPAYKDSGVEWLGEIPAHWEVKQAKWISSIFVPQRNKPELNLDQGLPWVTMDDLKSPSISYSSAGHKVSEKDAQLAGSKTLPENSVIASCVGNFGVASVNTSPVIINQQLQAYIPKKVNPWFLRYFISVAKPYFDQIATATTLSYVNRESFGELPVLTPPLPEQRAIAAFLDRETAKLDTLMAKKRRLIELLQEKRAALISQVVTKGLNPDVPMKDSGVEWLGEIPGHWEVKRLKFLVSFVTSGSRGWAQYYSDEGALFLRVGNLSRASIDLKFDDIQYVSPPTGTEGERTQVHPDDLLISITAYIGSVGVVGEEIGEAYVNQHVALTRPIQKSVCSRWIGYCLFSTVGQSQFGLFLYGGTKDGLGLDDVRNLIILVPSLNEQRAIAAHLDRETARIDALIAKTQETIEKLQEYRAALISAAVTGKIEVTSEA